MNPILNETAHGILDYATVLAFLAAPSLVALDPLGAALSYALAAVHLAMTLATDMRLGVWRLVPLRLHGLVELTVGIALVALGLFGAPILGPSMLFLVAGVAILGVWALTDYRRGVAAVPAE